MLYHSVLLAASACVQLNQFEAAIMWCEKGLAVSFIADATTKHIDQSGQSIGGGGGGGGLK